MRERLRESGSSVAGGNWQPPGHEAAERAAEAREGRDRAEGADRARSSHVRLPEDPGQEPSAASVASEPSATRVRTAAAAKKCCSESATAGHHDLRGCKVLFTDDHASGDVERAGGTRPRVCGGDI